MRGIARHLKFIEPEEQRERHSVGSVVRRQMRLPDCCGRLTMAVGTAHRGVVKILPAVGSRIENTGGLGDHSEPGQYRFKLEVLTIGA
jgi:hypothetical protein